MTIDISGDTSNANSGGLFFNRNAQQNGNDGNNVTLSPTTSHGLNSSSSNQNIEGNRIFCVKYKDQKVKLNNKIYLQRSDSNKYHYRIPSS